MAQELPTYFGDGSWITAEEVHYGVNYSYAFNATVPNGYGSSPNNIYTITPRDSLQARYEEWSTTLDPLPGVARGCVGKCSAKIVAPAFAVSACRQILTPIDYNKITVNEAESVYLHGKAAPTDQQAFGVSVGLILGTKERAYLVTGFYEGEDCVGTLNQTACTLDAAIGEYTVTIEGGRVSTDGDATIIALADNTPANYTFSSELGAYPSTLALVLQSAWAQWDCMASYFASQGGFVARIIRDSSATIPTLECWVLSYIQRSSCRCIA